jgi:acyl-coenzyme A synthetase/AMP-(fatty) acid ligase
MLPSIRTKTASAFKSFFDQLLPAAVLILDGHAIAAQQAAQTAGVPIIVLSPVLSEEAGRFRLRMPSIGEAAPYAEPLPDNLALLLQTCGTAGGPKLAIHTHQTLLTGARLLAKGFQLSERDRTINIAPLFHSLATKGAVLAAVVSGGSVICAPGSDPQLFFEWMDELSPTWFGAVPSMLQAILQRAPEFDHVIRRRPLRFFRSVAAPLPRTLADRLEDIFHAPLIQVYYHRTH